MLASLFQIRNLRVAPSYISSYLLSVGGSSRTNNFCPIKRESPQFLPLKISVEIKFSNTITFHFISPEFFQSRVFQPGICPESVGVTAKTPVTSAVVKHNY